MCFDRPILLLTQILLVENPTYTLWLVSYTVRKMFFILFFIRKVCNLQHISSLHRINFRRRVIIHLCYLCICAKCEPRETTSGQWWRTVYTHHNTSLADKVSHQHHSFEKRASSRYFIRSHTIRNDSLLVSLGCDIHCRECGGSCLERRWNRPTLVIPV